MQFATGPFWPSGMVRRVRLVGIYDADGGLAGELRYALGKLRGRSKCALCDITHGWNPMGSRQWKQACAATPVELELVHRDEATAAQLAAAAQLPAIVAHDGERWSAALSTADITACAGSPELLLERLAEW
ncbi:hypothetical protein [Candidatus Poriferisodalis sp.]|uniref:hypothetical protein n=1 Tax=Candidatus Poriferisodalis sp. TaxID=3101277 RepID=UPI003B022604